MKQPGVASSRPSVCFTVDELRDVLSFSFRCNKGGKKLFNKFDTNRKYKKRNEAMWTFCSIKGGRNALVGVFSLHFLTSGTLAWEPQCWFFYDSCEVGHQLGWSKSSVELMFFLRGDSVEVDLSHSDAEALVVLSPSTLSHCCHTVVTLLSHSCA